MGTFAEKENTLKVFHDTKNDGWEFPEYGRDPASHLINISENHAILPHGTTLASLSATGCGVCCLSCAPQRLLMWGASW